MSSDAPPLPVDSYYRASESAKASLIFILPWVVFYEVGTYWFTFDASTNTEQRIVAFTMLRDSLAALGATARWVAPASVVSILLAMMIVRRERVTVRVMTLLGMLVESVALAVPLILFSMVLAQWLMPMLANQSLVQSLGPDVVLSVGAGIYEELLFRLIGLAVLHFALVDFLALRAKVALPAIIGISAAAFSLYHYWGPEDFAVQTFVFRFVAGAYFGVLLLHRGFGITAVCHASYDLMIVGLRAMSHDA
jgi:hypothetical protein